MRVHLIFLAATVLQVGVMNAEAGPRFPITRLYTDQLGESLKKFHSTHKDASCMRRPIGEVSEENFEVNGSPWIDCGAKTGLTFKGQKLVDELNPTRPLGASFYKKRLVELTYTFDVASIETLLPILRDRYGEANRVTHDTAGAVDSALWIDHEVQLTAEVVPMSPVVAEKDFLRVEEGAPSNVVQIKICSTRPLSRVHPHPRRKNLIGKVTSFAQRHPKLLLLLVLP